MKLEEGLLKRLWRVQSYLVNMHMPATGTSFGSWRLSEKGRVAKRSRRSGPRTSLVTVPTVPSLVHQLLHPPATVYGNTSRRI